MPLFKKKGNNVDYKARLENKLYVARVNPEPDFDLSDCNLKEVPSGVFALCKVFRKENLFLENNQLISLSGGGNIEDLHLLLFLDVHSNALSKLPNEIGCLTNLRELNVSGNKLTSLPARLGEMINLCQLKAADNNLEQLPPSIGNLRFLEHLDVQSNKNLTKLPPSLCHAVSMREILLDEDILEYPPRDIVNQGLEAIMRFLCSEDGVEYVSPDQAFPETVNCKNNERQPHIEDDVFKAKILQFEALKEQKQRERLALEENIFEQQRRELEVHNVMKSNKEKLLEDLACQQSQFESEILKVQQEREAERLRLVNEIQRVDDAAGNLISQLLTSCYFKNSLQTQTLIELESKEEERLLNLCHEEYQSLIHKDVFRAMESLLEEEAQREGKIREYERGKAESTRSILNQEVENDKVLNNMLLRREKDQESLMSQIQQDEKLQRAAVATLLERGDARTWALTQHLRLVQEQLATLTALEMKRRHLHLNEQVDDLSHKRAALSELLVDLLDQQMTRRKRLLETLNELEHRRHTDEEQKRHDFWLVQYQRLLDLRSKELVELECNLDPLLAEHLLKEGVLHCLPLLTNFVLNPTTLEQMCHENLIQVGISSEGLRESLLRAVGAYLAERRQRPTQQPSPSAPPQSDVELGSKFQVAECVVCLDLEVGIVFVPCGHLCCCSRCSESLGDCPLCRASIAQKIRVIVS